MKRLLLLLSLAAIPAFSQCTIQTISGTQAISTAPPKLNANFASLNTCKPQRWSGTTVPGLVTGSLRGDIYLNTTTNQAYICFAVGPCTAVASGNWVLSGSGTGTGTVTVVGSGNLGVNQCVTGGGSQALQTPSSKCTVDSSGNHTANSYSTNDTTHSSAAIFGGVTSGAFAIVAADAAGSAVAYVWPTAPPVSFPKSLQITGTVTCPTLSPDAPTVCYQLAWQ